MKKLITLLVAILCSSSYSQEYYYNGNEKIEIFASANDFIVFGSMKNDLKSGFSKSESFLNKNYVLLKDKKPEFSMKEFMGKDPKHISPAYKLKVESNFKMFPTKTIRVKLKPGKSEKELSAILINYDIEDIQFKYGIFRIKIKDISKVFRLSNILYESGIAEFAHPDFYVEKKLNQVNDPLFPLQYQMNNTGQTVDGVPGVNDIDCNALEAWDITLGDNITIAVIDQGLEAHEDFGSRLIGGHTPATNGDGSPLTNDATHGMNSAGVAAASDNNLGIRGVAPNANLLAVNIFAGATIGEAADGIIWATDNGADVLSNSWSFREAPCGYTNADIDNAILYAIGSNGRNGKGCVVIFAAGNGGGCVEYPATNPNVIAVGAIDHQGNQYGYSARGPELDLVAPSGLGAGGVGIRTLDRMGAAGDFAGNYKDDFDGTSASCPVVSGVAALVLSLNPALTQLEVRDILNNTATDMDVNGFDNNFGNGRVNAFAAVQAAQAFTILGPDFICDSATYTLQNGGGNVTWQISSNLSIVSSTNSSVTVQPTSTFISGQGFIDAVLPSGSIRRDIWVGQPRVVAKFSSGEYIAHGSVNNVVCRNEQLTTNMDIDGANTSTWSLISSSHTVTWYQQGNNISFYLWAVGHTATFRFTTSNECGSITRDFKFVSEDCGGGGDDPCGISYTVSPTLADDEIEINFIPPPCDPPVIESSTTTLRGVEESKATLYDFSGNPVIIRTPASGKMNVEKLKPGHYILVISNNGKNKSHRIVIN